MPGILIANQDTTFLDAMKDQLSAFHEVYTCSDGRKVLELCQKLTPDLLVIDLEMPHLDGISALHLLHDSGCKPEVLVISGCLFSGYVLQTLARMDVSFVLTKPCTVEAVVSMAYEIMGGFGNSELDGYHEIERMLLLLGTQPGLNGHAYLIWAISLLQADPTLQITKNVYPTIAQQFHVTDTSIERAIRTCIHKAWEKRNRVVWNMFFPCGRDGNAECPSNGAFVSRLAVCFQKRKIG